MGSKSVRSFVAASIACNIVCGCWITGTLSGQTTAGKIPEKDAPVTTVSDATVASNTTTVTISATGVPLRTVLREIAKQAHLTAVYGNLAEVMARPVTMQVRNMIVAQAFDAALSGTGVKALIVGDQVVFTNASGSAVVTDGVIEGKVVSAKTKAPLAGVTVALDGSRKGIVTDSRGVFRFPSVAAGSHVVSTRLIGYTKTSQTVDVADGKTVAIEIALSPNASTLDQVIVTGTVIPTEKRAIPNAITVITAKQIEERGITRIDQLFRGDVPGVFAQTPASNRYLDEVVMYSRGATTAYGFNSQGTNFNTNPIKTYVDGVEMADSKYLSQIDPKSIERIEILTGPQASTIYGSNAINGVMQIFTKRGTTTKPQLTLDLQSGFVQNDFTPALTPQHDYGAQIAGQGGPVAYSGGVSWGHVGAWTPAKQTTRMNVFGGTRLTIPTSGGPVTLDASLRRGHTVNQQHASEDAAWASFAQSGYYRDPQLVSGAVDYNETYSLSSQTLGFTLGYAPTSWWSHDLSFGQDAEDSEDRRNAARYTSVSDSALAYNASQTNRQSIRYSTTARVPVSSVAQLTTTFGIDGWNSLSTQMYAAPMRLTPDLGDVYLARQTAHNRGGFIQSQFALFDQLFFTYGLRAEWNPAFGEDANPNFAPRYGVAYARDIGPVTAKVRMTYGRSTRPPSLDQKIANPASPIWDADLIRIYGPYNLRIANQDLGPESQQGGEGGIELYFGGRASLVVTRYNQTVNNLIAAIPGADSVKSLLPNPGFFGGAFTCAQIISFNIPTMCSSQDADGYGYAWQTQNINAASIRNQGWEVQGSVTTGPLTTRGTYSWTKSRTIGITSRYQSAISSLLGVYPQYVAGQSFDYVPEHTWAFGTTYARSGTTVALNVNGVGKIRSAYDAIKLNHVDEKIRLFNERWRVDRVENYISYNRGYAQTDLTASQRFTSKIDGLLQIQNLTNFYGHDYSAGYASLGRQSKAGLRIRL